MLPLTSALCLECKQQVLNAFGFGSTQPCEVDLLDDGSESKSQCSRSTGSQIFDLQTVVSAMWVPGFEPGSFGRAVSALNHLAIFPAHMFF
ncbi:hypothetical protein STEG23_028423 [Scotinomys teguina]